MILQTGLICKVVFAVELNKGTEYCSLITTCQCRHLRRPNKPNSAQFSEYLNENTYFMTVSFMSSLQLFLLKFEHLSGFVFIQAEESEVSVSVCENMKREMERDMRESHSENLEHYVMLAEPPPCLHHLCAASELWLVHHPVAYKSHWLSPSQLLRTWQERERDASDKSSRTQFVLIWINKTRINWILSRTLCVSTGLCVSLAGLWSRGGSERSGRAGGAAGGGARWEHGRLSSSTHTQDRDRKTAV